MLIGRQINLLNTERTAKYKIRICLFENTVETDETNENGTY